MDPYRQTALYCETDHNNSTTIKSQPIIAGILTFGQRISNNDCSKFVSESRVASTMDGYLQAKGYNLIIKAPNEHEGGRRLDNGSWTGLMKDLINGTIDFTMSTMVFDKNRIGVAAATPAYHWRGGYLTGILYKDQMANINSLQTLMIFDAWSWSLYMTSFILVPCFSIVYIRLKSLLHNSRSVKYPKAMRPLNFYAALLGQDPPPFRSVFGIKGQIISLLVLWIFTCFMWRLLFSSDLLSYLSFRPKVHIEWLEQLFEDERFKSVDFVLMAGKTYFFNYVLPVSDLLARSRSASLLLIP